MKNITAFLNYNGAEETCFLRYLYKDVLMGITSKNVDKTALTNLIVNVNSTNKK